MELKVVRAGAKVALSPHQISFADRAARAGVPVYLLVQYWPKEVLRSADSRVYAYRSEQVVEVARQGIAVQAWMEWTLGDTEGLQRFLKGV